MIHAIRILLAEDNQWDVLLVREALKEHRVEHELYVMKDGLEAARFIEQIGKAAEAPCPDILLLDLNLPYRDGHELLQLFRAHPVCGHKPVIVVTSSDAESDRKRAVEFGATRYFRKPTELEAFIELGAIVQAVVVEEAT